MWHEAVVKNEVRTKAGSKTGKYLNKGDKVRIDSVLDKPDDKLDNYGLILEGPLTGYYANHAYLKDLVDSEEPPTEPPTEPPVDRHDHLLISEFFENGDVILNQTFVLADTGEESL